MIKKILLSTLIFLFCYEGFAQQKITLSGYVKDAANGEALIGATVYIPELESGTTTNIYGFYSVTVPTGTYSIDFSYIGYTTLTQEFELSSNKKIDIELEAESTQLEEVVISAEEETSNITSIEMSTEKLDIKTIERIPAFLGEIDILKSIQLLPGVSSVGEGSSGFNVRGGGVGQNLVLLDDAPVYNSSHLFGFFSVFNPDAVKDVKLIKGGIPANYGGRIASILDVRMKEGNSKEMEISGGIGTVFSRLAVQGPIKKDKASFIVAGRRSYIDVLASPFLDDDAATLYFYDLTTKINYEPDPNNRFFLSGYFGRDVFRFDERQGFNWGNVTGTLRWNHLFNDRLFSNFAFITSTFDYGFAFGDNDQDKFDWKSRIITNTFKPYFNYFLNNENELLIGGEATYYDFKPAEAIGVSDGFQQDISLNERFAFESALYIDNTQKVSDRLTLKYGLRYSNFAYLGASDYYEFEEGIPGFRRDTISSARAGSNEVIEMYHNFEPRVSMTYQFTKSSIKASYNRTAQYIHLVSNTAASTPIDLWTPSTNNIRPQLGDQYTLGYFRNFKGNQWETSIEGYYRDTQNQVEYVRGADIFINELLEGDLTSGDGRAYGVELSIKKNAGNWTGWLSYTLGRSELKVDGINQNQWYPTRFDQTHNLKLFGEYQFSPRTAFSANFVYITGSPITAPTSRFVQQGYVIPYNYYDSRNNYRIPATHRLDLALRIDLNKPGKKRKNDDYLVISVYNVYGNKNPFSLFFAQEDGRITPGDPLNTQAYQFSIIGAPVPAISYNFRF